MRGWCGARRGEGVALRRAGVTLLELLVVLAVIALAGVVVLPSLMRAGGRGETERVREKLVGLVRHAQVEATRRGAPVSVTYEPGVGLLQAGEESFRLPSGWKVWVIPGGESTGAWRLVKKDGGPVEVVTWSPGRLASACAARLTGGGGTGEVVVMGDAIDGVRVSQ
ncbi:MAG: prepilin-type N-terminal cleavage/methylation domain-containing protein [Phycisphaerales bacterium]